MEYYGECADYEEDEEWGGCIHEDERSVCSVHGVYCERMHEPEDPDLWKQPN